MMTDRADACRSPAGLGVSGENLRTEPLRMSREWSHDGEGTEPAFAWGPHHPPARPAGSLGQGKGLVALSLARVQPVAASRMPALGENARPGPGEGQRLGS